MVLYEKVNRSLKYIFRHFYGNAAVIVELGNGWADWHDTGLVQLALDGALTGKFSQYQKLCYSKSSAKSGCYSK